MAATDALATVVRRILTVPPNTQTSWDAGRLSWKDRQALDAALTAYEAHLDIDEAHQDDPDERITAPCCEEGETE